MVSEILHDKAVQYVSGDMSAPERESFERLIELHEELRGVVGKLTETMSAVTFAGLRQADSPSPGLKGRILSSVEKLPAHTVPDAVVSTDAAGRIEWVNDAFTAMCGYSLDELKGRKPGAVLQGARTDVAVVARIRDSLRAGRECRETLINYHKDGSAYRVDLHIAPILDEDGRAHCFVARERKLEAV